MFQVKKTEYTNKTFQMPLDLVHRLETLAQNSDISLNNLVLQCCHYALDNMDKSKIRKQNPRN